MARVEDTYALDHARKGIHDVTLRQWGFIAGLAIFAWGLVTLPIWYVVKH